ncbi:MAG: hypothetical protein A3F70_01265 [Acidobacteria bacterium RIFCSPLOWO2_12_FULL_67_14]|nr:MAG: hypothetical protein A3H29_12400 [Acidobacteria bacterium RIFCSPLOWO2_02_FULL_67_21]OFW38428.1 MAG: hypothetical protein A3F70_01265 [Acidobacteria bacterium RIFCSPLOWO2_12_FULL_67_14]
MGFGIYLAAALIGCRPSGPLLSQTYPSPHATAAAVLQALEQRDIATLRSLALSEQEFREHVWPELPAARPERNLPFSYGWGDLHQKSEAALAQTLVRHGGRRYQLVSVRFDGDATSYPSYRVHRETVLQVRDERGEVADVRLFGASLEKDGVWKVFSYVVDQ